VNRLRKQLQRDFPQAFVIAFKGGVKMDPKAAYDEYVNKKKKKK
jgi:N-acetylmuramoyl-L-alanine amidase